MHRKVKYAGKRPYNQAFEKRLDDASYWEAVVSAYLARQGFRVIHNPIVQSPVFDLNTPDLVVEGQWAPFRSCKVEVKFTKEHVWPESDDDVFICSAHSFDRKKPAGMPDILPVPYVLVDPHSDMRVFLPMTPLTRAERWDKGRNDIFTAMYATVEHRKPIKELVTWLVKEGVMPLPQS